MASGGGGHPSHLPIIPPITSQHHSSGSGNNSVGTGGRVRGSLQTPDASSLFVSSLGGTGMGGSGNSNTTNANFAPSPIDHSQSFNSLEELLNVTGISSLEMELPNGAKRLREQDGVDSLQRIAKEVESRESGAGSGMLEPPNKRMHLDSPLNVTMNATTASPGLGSYASIRSSSTTTLPSLPAFSSSLPQSTFTNSIHSTTPIASLLDKRDFPGSSNSSVQEPKLSNTHNRFPQSNSVSLPSISSHLPSLPPPPPYNFNSTSSVGVAPQNAPPAIGGTSVSNGNSSTHFSSTPLVDLTVGSSNTGGMKQTQPPTNYSQPANLSQPSQPTRLQQQPATVPPQQPAGGSQGSNTTSSKLADSINTNSRSVVIQLMQLYKQYQSLNDQQGMKRVRDQLNMLVSAQQKILAAQNNMAKTTTERATTEAAPSTAGSVAGGSTGVSTSSQPVAGGRMGGVSAPSTHQPQQQQQQQQAHQILGQLAGIAKGIQSRTGSSGTQMWQGGGGGGGGGNVPSSASATNHIRNTGTSADWQGGSFTEKGGASLPPPPAYSDVSVPSSSVVNTPPSLLSHMGSGASAGTNAGVDSQTGTQKAVKQIRMLMDALPDSKRPKNVQELKEFVLQRYSSLVNKGAGNGGGSTNATSSAASFLSKTSAVPSSSTSPLLDSSSSRGQLQQQGVGSVSQSPSAHVAEHFRNSLMGSSTSSSASLPSVSKLVGGTEIPSSLPPSSRTLPLPTFPPSSSSSLTVGSVLPDSMKSLSSSQQQQHLSGSGTMHAPVTSQFGKSPVPSTLQSNIRQNPMAPPPSAPPPSSATSSSSSAGIQAGIPTPLPPGLTLETLGVLCRLPENELQKLKLPPALLSAIKVWKARQVPGTKAKVPTAAAKAGNIPVLIPPPSSDQSTSLNSSSSTSGQLSMIPSHSSSIVAFNNKPSASPSLPPPPPHPHHLVVTPKNHSLGIGQPNVIPSGAGFPPRSLHAYIPGSSTSLGLQTTPRYQSSGTSTSAATSQHLTRYKLKVEQQKVKNERFQALQKALETSEEARIAFRFSAHLEKMHSQLLNPDTVNAFRSHNDILARLLPYHLYAEPEPPPAAVEKADAVFESVAQVLLSRSRGLKSRFEQTIMKSNTEGGAEHRNMQMQLERLFIEGEQERIQKEKQEKKEAEQIAADLSLMVDHVGTFDSEFSFGDVFNPLMSMDSGIT